MDRRFLTCLTVLPLLLCLAGCSHRTPEPAIVQPPPPAEGEPFPGTPLPYRIYPEPSLPGPFPEPPRFAVSVASNPGEARVFLDGEHVGTTPCTLVVYDRPAVLTLVKEGHFWATEVIVDSTRNVHLSLSQASIPGPLLVEAAMAGLTPPAVRRYPGGELAVGPLPGWPQLAFSPSGRRLALVYQVDLEGHAGFWLGVASVVDLDTGLARIVAARLGSTLVPSSYGHDAGGIEAAVWADDEHLLLLTSRARPGSAESAGEDLVMEVFSLEGGLRRLAGFSHYLQGYSSGYGSWHLWPWVPAGGNVAFLHRYEWTAGAELWRIDLRSGEKTLLRRGAWIGEKYGESHLALSPDGWKVVHGDACPSGPDRDMRVLDLETGRESPLLPPGAVGTRPRWSPDGSRVAVLVGEKDHSYRVLQGEDGYLLLGSAVWIGDSAGRPVARIAIPGKTVQDHAWTADSRHVLLLAAGAEEEGPAGYPGLVEEGVYVSVPGGEPRLLIRPEPGVSRRVESRPAGWLTLREWDGRADRCLAIREAGETPAIIKLPGSPLGVLGPHLLTEGPGEELFLVTPEGATHILTPPAPLEEAGGYLVFEDDEDGGQVILLVPVQTWLRRQGL